MTTAAPTTRPEPTSTAASTTTAASMTTTAPMTTAKPTSTAAQTTVKSTTLTPTTKPTEPTEPKEPTSTAALTTKTSISTTVAISSLKDETQKNIADVTSILEDENIDPESEIGKNLNSLLSLLQGLQSGLDSIGGSSGRQKRDIDCASINGIIRQINSLVDAAPLLKSHGFEKSEIEC